MSVLVIRLLLAAVFVTAAVAKLGGRSSLVETLQAFGVSTRAARPPAVLLPLVELAVAAALVPAATARYGAFGAAALLAVFTAAVAYQLLRGRQPACNCFGRLTSAPIGPETVARNAVLLAAACFVARGGQAPSPTPLQAIVAGLGLLVVAETVLLIALLRRHGRLLARSAEPAGPEAAAGLPLGADAPEFELPDLEGELVSLRTLRERGLPVLLLFSDPACGPCSALLPRIGRWQREHDSELAVVVVSNGADDDNRASASEHGLTQVLRQEGHAVGLAYGANGTPMGVLVDLEGRVASPVAAGANAIDALVATAVQVSEEVLLHV